MRADGLFEDAVGSVDKLLVTASHRMTATTATSLLTGRHRHTCTHVILWGLYQKCFLFLLCYP